MKKEKGSKNPDNMTFNVIIKKKNLIDVRTKKLETKKHFKSLASL